MFKYSVFWGLNLCPLHTWSCCASVILVSWQTIMHSALCSLWSVCTVSIRSNCSLVPRPPLLPVIVRFLQCGLETRLLGPSEERCFLTMEDAEDSAAGPPQCTCFAEPSAERSQWLATLRKRKQRSLWTKKPRRQEENERMCKKKKKKARWGESSQARYKLCSLLCSIQP